MTKDPGYDAHREWLGYVQPSGLVVSIPALLDADARINRNDAPDHRRFLSALPTGAEGEPVPEILNFSSFAETVFAWSPQDLYGAPGAPPLPDSLEITLPDYHETLRPTFALHDFKPADPNQPRILLIHVLPRGTDLDKVATSDERHWQASPQAKFERLLRQTHVPIGLLVNERQIRLVYAPEKELSGHITFNLADMVKVAGRPILSAMLMLLHEQRLYAGAEDTRLPAILSNSRKYQNMVSTKLAEQVVEALYELLRGFQAAHDEDEAQGALLRDVLARDPEEVYRGLLTTLLRLVFILYAEDRDLLSTDPIYANHYSIAGLYERLRADDGRYHDTMGQRYGAWAQLLVLFRLIHSGARHGVMNIPAREGYLFDPQRYRFLEGRRHKNDKVRIPRVSDGVIFRVLTRLRVLDGERLSYRTLAVEQIGSVYQAIMGFGLEVAKGRSIAIRPAKKHGAPATINLEELLATAADKREKWFAKQTDQKLTGKAADDLKSAANIDELLKALEKKIAVEVTPAPVPRGAMIFQPSDERRKSGSHYTPSSLTGPIVEAALEPVLRQLGEKPTPAQILNLKVCDLAMGSAAFLVEACRQLGDALVNAWHAHHEVPVIPLDEDEALYAQRLVSQRCLYGLDKNQMAADLAKLSLWLATLAKDHPFTFLDHSLRHGDALVGLTRKQIAAFNWAPAAQQSFLEELVRKSIDAATEHRQRILNARDTTSYAQLEQELGNVEDALSLPCMIGDAAIAAFFSGEKAKQREEARKRFAALIETDLKKQRMIPIGSEVDSAVKELRTGKDPTPPFHWELEFPEVFTTDKSGSVTGGFDVIVGNPPFMGGRLISGQFSNSYLDWLLDQNVPAGGQTDLVAYFFRAAFSFLRNGGALGLIGTNTISQGDTRRTGLFWICHSGGCIYRANKRIRWPGEAAVVVSVVHIVKGIDREIRVLNGRHVDRITAYLFHQGLDEDPAVLKANAGLSFKGMEPYGHGFFFDDFDADATPLAVMREILLRQPDAQRFVLPYIGGSELLSDPTQSPFRYVISFGDMELDDCSKYPLLLDILRQKVKAERQTKAKEVANWPWWKFWRIRAELHEKTRQMNMQLVHPFTSTHLAFSFVPTTTIVASPHVVVAREDYGSFAVLQSRIHDLWAWMMSSSMKDDLRYAPTDCFATFPFPNNFGSLEEIGRSYYKQRAESALGLNEGLTTIYNWFHDPHIDLPDVHKMRERQTEMDRAVLDAYGWTDIQPKCEFIPEFDDEEEEDDGGRPKKKKYRYRWADEIRDEVLARLLELNRQRALEEGQMVAEAAPKKKKAKKKEAETPLFDA
ncbi:MAG TPA: type IIL restriction-modification enzyme MmeI [Candidatus Angelobacter sp.]|nr:type IIL restriction-modification enzyme MmeI [Candidatus Angelobacter sp.]